MSKFTSCQMGIPRLSSSLFILYIPANWSSYLGLTPRSGPTQPMKLPKAGWDPTLSIPGTWGLHRGLSACLLSERMKE